MRVAFIIDEQRLAAESAMLLRLTVGLLAESVHVTRILPEGITSSSISSNENESAASLAPSIRTHMHAPFWLRAARRQKLINQLERTPPAVIVGFGLRTWSIAADLAHAFNVPAAVEISSLDEALCTSHTSRIRGISAFVTAARSLAERLVKNFGAGSVFTVPPGVSAIPDRSPSAHEHRALSIAVLNNGFDVAAHETMLIALKELLAQRDDAQLFIELNGRHAHDIWRVIRRLDLLSMVSTIDNTSHCRSLLSHCDLVLLPEPLHAIRTLVLEAMVAGAVVHSCQDDVQDMLVPDRTARIVTPTTTASWVAALEPALRDPLSLAQLRKSARDHIHKHHRSSHQVQAMFEALERIAARGNLAFPRPNAA